MNGRQSAELPVELATKTWYLSTPVALTGHATKPERAYDHSPTEKGVAVVAFLNTNGPVEELVGMFAEWGTVKLRAPLGAT